MKLKLKQIIRHIVGATRFWQDNYIILHQFKYFKFIAAIAIGCTLMGAFFDGVTVSLIATFLQGLTNPHEPPIQTGISWFDGVILATNASASARVYRLAAVILIAIWWRSLLHYGEQLYTGLVQCHLSDRIRKLIFEQLQSLSLSYYTQISSGEPLNSITREVNELKQVFNLTANIIAKVSTLLAYILSMFWLSWQLSIVAVLMFSLLSVGLSTLIAKVREASFALPQANGQLTSVAIEFISGIRTVQASVGSSGAGKTTLVDLITRFYDPVRGQILIDGIDLRDIEINSLRRQMGIVSQDTFIFNTSVRENIAYGLENIDESTIIEVARQANAWEFIQEFPQGMDTILGDRGVRLSGGQRQRIAIARAILRNPEILILDEATSALDSVTERLIQQSLDRLTKGRTVIAIAHRLSTIMRADKILVLKGGRIVEQGGYGELIAQRGELWQYHQMQFEPVA